MAARESRSRFGPKFDGHGGFRDRSLQVRRKKRLDNRSVVFAQHRADETAVQRVGVLEVGHGE